MISPQAVHFIIQHFDALDEAVSRRLVRKRPWSEPALTSLLCDLLDENTQEEEKVRYTIQELNSDLKEHDGLLNVSFQIETHEYDPNVERWVTQSDLGLILQFEDNLLPQESWSSAWLLQAKRLTPSSRNPLSYTETSRFRSHDAAQQQRIERLEKVIGLSFARYLLYCPRPSFLDQTIQHKLSHLRNRSLNSNIFDYTLGLEQHKLLSQKNSPFAAGLFVCRIVNFPRNLGDVHERILRECDPLAWFIVQFLASGNHGAERRPAYPNEMRIPNPSGRGNTRRRGSIPSSGAEWAHDIVRGDTRAIERLITELNQDETGPFPFLPAHTITFKVSVGHDLDPETRQISRE